MTAFVRWFALAAVAVCLSAAPVLAAGSSTTQSGVLQDNGIAITTVTFTADDTNGSIPTLVLGIPGQSYIFKVVTNPGATAPTDNWDVAITDADGADLLGGAGANRDTTTSETAYPLSGTTPVYAYVAESPTIAITGNSVNSAVGTVVIYSIPASRFTGQLNTSIPLASAVLNSPAIDTPTITGPLTMTETLDTTEALTQTCTGWGLATPVGASSCTDTTITRTASGSNLTVTNGATISEGASGTWYRWDVATNLTASTITPSFCGQTLTAISTTGALVTTYRLFCPYQAAALAAPVLTFTATTAGTVDVAATSLRPITSVESGTGLVWKAGAGAMHFVLGATTADFWQGADALGIRVRGYDDMKDYALRAYVDSAGDALLTSVGNLKLVPGSGLHIILAPASTSDTDVRTDSDSLFQTGDGTYSWQHSPQNGFEGVAEFDAKAWFDAGLNVTGQATVSGTAPAVGTCGTTPAIASGSTDHAGLVTVGSGATTACTLTFAVAYSNEPVCVVSTEANVTAYISAKSATAMTVTFSADAASQQWDYVCFGL